MGPVAPAQFADDQGLQFVELRLTWAEAESSDLPAICIPCGAPAYCWCVRECHVPSPRELLNDGRIACAGHFGADDPIGGRDQYVSVHSFRLKVFRKTKDTHIRVERGFEEARNRWWNRYTLTLTSAGEPLAGKELEFWYVERGKPGYDSWNR